MTELASTGQLRAIFIRWALVLVPLILLLGLVSGQIAGSGPENPWFAALNKPSLYPPPAAFAIVWTILYILMGMAVAMIVAARGAQGRQAAIAIFIVQLVLNLSWSPVFFGAHQITAALVLLIVLDMAVTVTIVRFRAIRPVAALLLLPYLAWIVFATFLTWEFRTANPGMDGQDVSSATTRIEF